MRIARLALFALLTLPFTPNLFAVTAPKFAVGTCEPNLQSFPTIQSAVTSVPSGATIFVCPGNYPEQVVISQPLTLQGVNIGGSGAAVITVPSGGMVQNATFDHANTAAVQLLVENPGGAVNLTNLVIDGTGGTFVGGFMGGAFYQEASGTVSHVVLRHQFTGETNGVAMLAESLLAPQTVTVLNSTMHDFDEAGVFLHADPTTQLLTVSFKSNTIRGPLDAIGILADSALGTLQSNLISQVGTALDVVNNSSLTVISNNLAVAGGGFTPGAVVLDGGTNTLRNNQLDAGSGVGVELLHFNSDVPDANIIQANTISNSSIAVSGCNDGAITGNTISGNHIIDANIGISVYNGNTTVPNTYYGVTTFVSPCGPAPELRNRAAQSQRRPALSFAY